MAGKGMGVTSARKQPHQMFLWIKTARSVFYNFHTQRSGVAINGDTVIRGLARNAGIKFLCTGALFLWGLYSYRQARALAGQGNMF